MMGGKKIALQGRPQRRDKEEGARLTITLRKGDGPSSEQTSPAEHISETRENLRRLNHRILSLRSKSRSGKDYITAQIQRRQT